MNKIVAIQQFLEEFEGDAVAAVKALRDYVRHETTAIPRRQATSNEPVLLAVKNVTRTYKLGKQKLEVLKGVSIDIHAGEFVAITGASGSGKSTLLQLMGGLDKPTSGRVYFGDQDLAVLSDGKLSEFRRQTVGFVFQFFYLQPFLKLGRNLEVPAMFAGVRRKERRRRMEELAESVGLSDRIAHLPRELSGGQMQRAAIARALMNRPKILLADEPTGNLDSATGKAIIDLFEMIRRELGMTVVIVTHDPAIAARADREIRLRDGALV